MSLTSPSSPLWPSLCGVLLLSSLRTDATGFLILASASAAGLLLCSCVEEGDTDERASAMRSSVPNPRKKKVEKTEDDKGEDVPPPSASLPTHRGHASLPLPRKDALSQERLRDALAKEWFGR